jgi:hypothetical protein
MNTLVPTAEIGPKLPNTYRRFSSGFNRQYDDYRESTPNTDPIIFVLPVSEKPETKRETAKTRTGTHLGEDAKKIQALADFLRAGGFRVSDRQKQVAKDLIKALVKADKTDFIIGMTDENEITLGRPAPEAYHTLTIDEDGDVFFYSFSNRPEVQASYNEFFDFDDSPDYTRIVERL